jgi:hypothetical protein
MDVRLLTNSKNLFSTSHHLDLLGAINTSSIDEALHLYPWLSGAISMADVHKV